MIAHMKIVKRNIENKFSNQKKKTNLKMGVNEESIANGSTNYIICCNHCQEITILLKKLQGYEA